jgi:mono/diheme cytochrome c family protein
MRLTLQTNMKTSLPRTQQPAVGVLSHPGAGWLLLCGLTAHLAAGAEAATASFRTQIHPILQQYCFDCHGDGAHKGNVAFDAWTSDQAVLGDRDLWFRVLKNLRAGLMPPPKKARPSAEQQGLIDSWIKTAVFESDPRDPDPGRVTLRRLNRVEYRNTIRDLMGVDFEVDKEFPPDDAGHGFDNIGDVLTVSPMLLEKYLAAAKAVVTKAVPAAAPAKPTNHYAKFFPK